MNLFNGVAAALLDMPYTPSPELTCAQIRALPGEKELVVYGRAVLMLLRHCPLNPVSYTHLDVYKRQQQRAARPSPARAGLASAHLPSFPRLPPACGSHAPILSLP